MKIYFSYFYDDVIFVIGGQPYFFFNSEIYPTSLCMVPVSPNHIKVAHMRKPEKDKEVIYICTIKD